MRGKARPRGLRVFGALAAATTCLSACGLLVGIEEIGVTSGAGGGGGGGEDGGGVGGVGGGGDANGGPDSAPPQGLGCDDAIPLVLANWGTLEIDADTTLATAAIESGPFTGCTTSSGPEHVYVFDAPQSGSFTASLPATATTFDSVLYARRTSCSNPDGVVLCHDQVSGILGGELLSFPVTMGERIYLFVDGLTLEDRGAYHLTVSFFPGTSCAGPVPIVLGAAIGSVATVLGANEAGMDNDAKCGSCSADVCAEQGRQTIYSIKAPLAKEIEVKLDATFDAVLYARTDCENAMSELAPDGCVDAPEKGDELIRLPGGVTPTILFVDTNPNSPAGPFSLRLTLK